MDNIWNIWAKEQELKRTQECRKQEIELKEKANKTPCDNCGKKPAYPVETSMLSDTLKHEYCGFKANLCEKCREKFVKDAYYHWDDD